MCADATEERVRDPQWDRVRRLGYPCHRPESPASSPSPSRLGAPALLGPAHVGQRRHEVGLVTICTLGYLHHARVLVESLRRHHDDIDAVVVVIDWDGVEPLPEIPATYWPLEALQLDRPAWLRLKFSAAHLCYAAKPAALRAMARVGYRKILYFDADIAIFAPLERLLTQLDSARFVILPHTLAPMVDGEQVHRKPALGDLAAAGVCNAGLLAMVPDAPSLAFVDQWEDMVLAPGAFRFHQAEQNALNWVIAFLDGVAVLRDPAYNVAYWNLHDRSVRWEGLDQGDPDIWRVDGQKLVAFHFSGLPFERPSWLSVHDTRNSLYVLPSVAKLVERYVADLVAADAFVWRQRPYRFDHFPSGVAIDERMRRVFRDHELFWRQDLDPFTEEGERYFCRGLLSPAPGSFLVPSLVWAIHNERGDTQVFHAGARLAPEGLLRWFVDCGCAEYGYQALFDRHRPSIPMSETALHLASVLERLPVVAAELAEPLGRDRAQLIRKFEQGRLPEAVGLRGADGEIWPLSPIYLVWQLVQRRPDLRANFPDFFESHADHLAGWLDGDGVSRHFLPRGLGAAFRRVAQGKALARVFSFLYRQRRMQERFPLALIGVEREAFAAALLQQFPADCEFDVDDVVAYLWQMAEMPASGLAATLELTVNREDRTSTLDAATLRLAPYFSQIPGLQTELARLRATAGSDEAATHLEASCRERVVLPEAVPHPAVGRTIRVGRGVNCFGYFKSPIGLGSLSVGLEAALLRAGYPVQRNVVGNMLMSADLTLQDLIGRFRYDYDTNLLVSYPHLHQDLLGCLPSAQVRGRRNIAYLAWEQRDGHPWWPQVFAGFEQLWALSTFAADALARFCERPVLAVPPVVDFASFPPPASKAAVGLPTDKMTFLYVFDANSSIERKNPEAAIRAFARAFSPGEPVELLIKASNADRLEHRRKMLQLVALGEATGHAIRWMTQALPRQELLGLISASDVYVSLHRAEGFGYTCAEAMAYGVPVVATGYSGNLDFMDSSSAFLVEWREQEVRVADGPFQRGSIWAEPDLDHAARCLRRTYEDRALAREIGARGRVMARERLALERVATIVGKALERG